MDEEAVKNGNSGVDWLLGFSVVFWGRNGNVLDGTGGVAICFTAGWLDMIMILTKLCADLRCCSDIDVLERRYLESRLRRLRKGFQLTQSCD